MLTGAELPAWSRLAAEGTPAPYPSGTAAGERDAHNGTVVVPPDPRREGVPVEQIAAYRWDGERFVEIPVQVDERFPYFLANAELATSASTPAPTRSSPTRGTSRRGRRPPASAAAAYPRRRRPDARPGRRRSTTTTRSSSWRATPARRRPPARPARAAPAPSARRSRVVDPLDPATDALRLPLPPSRRLVVRRRQRLRRLRARRQRRRVDRPRLASPTTTPRSSARRNTGYGPNLAGTVCDPDGDASAHVRPTASRATASPSRTDAYQWRATRPLDGPRAARRQARPAAASTAPT